MPSNDIGSLLFLLLPLLLLGYVFMSQRRRMRALQALHSSITVGDEVRTTSGLFGRVQAIADGVASIEIAPGVVARFDVRAIDTRVEPAAPADGSAPGTEGR